MTPSLSFILCTEVLQKTRDSIELKLVKLNLFCKGLLHSSLQIIKNSVIPLEIIL